MSAATTAIRANDARIQMRLLKLLAQDADWLFSERLEMGIRWLDSHYGSTLEVADGLPTIRARVGGSAHFWGWWNNHWGARDQQLEGRLKTEQLTTGEWALALWERPEDDLASKVFFLSDELRAWYLARHQVLAWRLDFDADLLRRIVRAGRLVETHKPTA